MQLTDQLELLKSMDSTETDDSAESHVHEDENGSGGDELDARELSSLLAKAALKATGHQLKSDTDQDGDNSKCLLDTQEAAE